MVSITEIKTELPSWPGGVLEQWLLPLANQWDAGWPVPNPLGMHRWAWILGHRPISWWQDVSWSLCAKDCSYSALSRDTRKIEDRINNEISFGGADEATERRYMAAYKYILEHASFPRPLVVIDLPYGVSVLDGNHRIAAYCFLRKAPDYAFGLINLRRPPAIQETWVGTHVRGELPLDVPPWLD